LGGFEKGNRPEEEEGSEFWGKRGPPRKGKIQKKGVTDGPDPRGFLTNTKGGDRKKKAHHFGPCRKGERADGHFGT